MATLRPLSSRSRKSAAVNLPVGEAAATSMAMRAMSSTIGRAKKWSCAISSTSPRRAAMRIRRRTKASSMPMALAMSRTRGGR